jgi:hypothetical protein
MNEPHPFKKGWFSHKFHHAGLRYEVATCIKTGDIVWLHGPFECGAWPDVKIFRDSLKSFLGPNERVEADNGYVGEAPLHVKCPKSFANPVENLKMQETVRARHETMNNRLKMWGCLQQRFRHDPLKHADVFRAVMVMTQLSINEGERLFNVQYDDQTSTSTAFEVID